MKKNNNEKSNKSIAVIVAAVATMVMVMCVGCGDNKEVDEVVNVETPNEDTREENKELVTYEFETFDNLKIKLDESNIIAQESSDDPEYSDLVPESARGNIIAPGRDYVYLEDDDYYYVADLSRNLITVADKSKVKAEVVETTSIAGTYSHTYTEEIEGSEMEFTNTVVLNEDNTCEINFQDTISGTWTEDKITLDDGNSYEFNVEGNTLNLNMDGVWISFSK